MARAHPAGILKPLRKVMDFERKRREEQYYENTTDTMERSLIHADQPLSNPAGGSKSC
jgi:hypothetical protein